MRNTLTLLFFLLSVLSLSAKDDFVTLSYCNGRTPSKGQTAMETSGWVDAAAYFPASSVNPLAGNQITTVRAALSSKMNVDSLRVWVRESLQGDNLSEASAATRGNVKLKSGWNELTLDKPYSLKAGQGVYIGFSYKQRAATAALSVVTDIQHADGYYLRTTDNNGHWQDNSQSGVLSVEGVVTGSSLPLYNLSISDGQVIENAQESTFLFTANVSNVGAKTVNGFTLTTNITPSDETFEQHFDNVIEPNATTTISYTLTPKSETAGDLRSYTLYISSLDDGNDADTENNTCEAAYRVKHNVLLEEFTTEPCPNCPTVAGWISNIMNQPKYADFVIPVAHHAGYYTDTLTTDIDKAYLAFYNNSQTFAPGVMYDRYPYFTVFQSSKQTPVTALGAQSEIEAVLNYRAAEATPLKLRVTATPENGSVIVNVWGRSTDQTVTPDISRIYVLATEDSIPTDLQRTFDGNGYVQGYHHEHVVRAQNATWGDEIQWNGDEFTYSYTIPASSDWKQKNMHVIAFASRYSESSPATGSEVFNSVIIPWPETNISTGIDKARADVQPSRKSYYTIEGVKVNAGSLTPGIYIVRSANANGKISSYKQVIG